METKEAERAEKDQANKSSSEDVMTQIMNASTGDKKPKRSPKAEQHKEPESTATEEPAAHIVPTVAEPMASQPIFDLGIPSLPSSSHGLTPLELARNEVLELIGPNGLGLRADEHERYFTDITGKGELKSLTQTDLQAVINDAKDRLSKRDE